MNSGYPEEIFVPKQFYNNCAYDHKDKLELVYK